MATDRETIKTWFETGDTPTEAQFAEALDSYVHQDDLSDVAKESSEKNIENKVLDNNSKLVAIATELNKIGSPAEGQPTTLFAAIAAGGSGGGGSSEDITEIKNTLNTLVNSHIVNGVSFEGWLFQNGYEPISFGDAFANISKLTSVNDSTIVSVNGNYFITGATNLLSLSLPNLEEINADCFVYSAASITSVNLPKLKKIYCSGTGIFSGSTMLTTLTLPSLYEIRTNTFRAIPSVEELYLPKLEKIYGQYNWWQKDNYKIIDIQNLTYLENPSQWSGCNNLIDLRVGKKFVSSMNLSTWSPANALKSDSATLIKNGEPFANNLEKLLYNIREHIAAYLPDRTGLSALTITFSAAVKAAINADATTAAAFTNKNWTIA